MRDYLATVSTDSFFPGTLVTISSFLRCNPWFCGEILIVHDELNPRFQGLLKVLYPHLRFVQVSNSLKEQATALVSFKPYLRGRVARFFSLETFALKLPGRRLLFLDSDIVVAGDLRDVFVADADQVFASRERIAYRGVGRDRETLAEVEQAKVGKTSMFPTINAGSWSVPTSLLNEDTEARVKELMSLRRWESVEARLTDQVVLNWLFESFSLTVLDESFNFLVPYWRELGGTGAVSNAKILHLVSPGKPWELADSVLKEVGDPVVRRVSNMWREQYNRVVGELHIKAIHGNRIHCQDN